MEIQFINIFCLLGFLAFQKNLFKTDAFFKSKPSTHAATLMWHIVTQDATEN